MPVSETANEEWLAGLSADSPHGLELQSDLRAYIHRTLAKVLSRRGAIDDAVLDDLTQEAMLRITANLHTFRGDSRFTTWASAVAVRVAFTQLRRQRGRDVSLDDLTADALTPAEDDPGRTAEQRAILDVMQRVIREQLTEKQRKALLGELAGIPQVALVESLDTNRNALYKLIHDARKRLKQGLADAGISEDEVRDSFGV